MSHIRKQIRDAVVTTLTGLASTGANVFPNRSFAVPPDKMPALCIYTASESSGLDGTASGLRREINVVVDAVFQYTTANFDDDADVIAAEVETALGNARTLGGLAYDVVPVATQLTRNGDGEQSIGICSMTFAVTTRTQIGAPDTVG